MKAAAVMVLWAYTAQLRPPTDEKLLAFWGAAVQELDRIVEAHDAPQLGQNGRLAGG